MRARLTQLAILAALGASAAPAGAQGRASHPAAGATEAQPAPSRWPAALAHRNARYAVLERVDDPAGDAREAFLATLRLDRVGDVLGDREEERRYVAGLRGHWASVHAHLDRVRDRAGDAAQAVLAGRTLARRYAKFARVRFPRVRTADGLVYEDALELAEYRRDLPRLGDPTREVVRIGEKKIDPDAARYIEDRAQYRAFGKYERAGREEDDEEKAIARSEREDEREDERQANREDADAVDDPLTEDGLERAEERAAAQMEGRLEASGERALERVEEREIDSSEERVLQKEEDGGL